MSLQTLPQELLEIVLSNLGQNSLDGLTRTCGELRGNATPVLYQSVMLRVPIRWSVLPSLETLITSGINFGYTRYISVVTQQDALRPSQQGPMDDSNRIARHSSFVVPSDHASHTLNTYIRMVIAKLPRHRLRSLR